MSCPNPEVLAAAVEGRVDPSEREAVLNHAALCDDCRHALLILRAVAPARAKPVLRFRPWMPWAAAAVFILSVAALLLTAAAAAGAAEAPGAELYRRYCAACHGISGQGDGPVARALVTRPTDLTRADAYGDVGSLMEVIDGRRAVAAHGAREMPVWGASFARELAGGPYPERTTLQQVRELAEYVLRLRAP